MFYFSRRVEMSYRMAQILPPSDKTFKDYKKFQSIFGEEANVVIIAIKDPTFFKQKSLQAWMSLEASIKKINYIEWTLSPASSFIILRNDSLKKFEYGKLLKNSPSNDAEADSIGKLFGSLPFYKELLWNPDSNAFVMLAGINKLVIHKKERDVVVNNIKIEIQNFEKTESKNLHISGLPIIRTDSIKTAKKETILFTILAAIVSSIILLFFFKSVRVLVVALAQVAIGVICSWGTMGILGYDLTVISGIIPPLLIVIGIPNTVYMVNRYQQEFLRKGDKKRALSKMIEKTGRAMFLTNITTAVGFATLSITSSNTLFEFGLVASINVIALFFLSLVWNTILFSYLPEPSKRHTKHLTNQYSARFIKWVELIVRKYRPLIFIITGIMVLASLYGMLQVTASGKVADDMPKHSDTYSDLKFFENNFTGVMPFEIMIDTKKKKKVRTSPKIWKKISELQDSIYALGKFSRPVSFVELIKYTNQAYYRGAPEQYQLPSSLDLPGIQNFIQGNKLQANDSLLQSYVDSTGRYVRIRAQMKDMGTFEMNALTRKIETQAKKIFIDEDVDITISGASVVILRGTQYLLRNLLLSISLAILIIALIMASMFRKFKMVIISLIPNILPLIFTAGAMGYFDIPLKASTIIVFGIAFGIAVDATIHFLTKYLNELKYYKGNIKESVFSSIREIGLSMSYTSLILFCGFSVFIWSDFGGTKALGILLSFTLCTGYFCDLLLLPSLLLSMQRKQIDKDYKMYAVIEEDDEHEKVSEL